MKAGMSKSSKRALIVNILIVILFIGLGVCGYFFVSDMIEKDWAEKVRVAEDEIAGLKRIAYVADRDIKAGETVDASNVSLCQVRSDMPSELFIAEGGLGGRAMFDISAGSQILKGSLTSVNYEDDVREMEFKFIYSGINIAEGDVVDVRIKFPDGTDYIIISKKTVEGLGENGEVILNVTEEELLLMDAAAVDAFIYSAERYDLGRSNNDEKYKPVDMSRIYAAKYAAPTTQEAARTFYTPSEAILNELENDPNIIFEAREYLTLTVREELEERLQKFIVSDGNDNAPEPTPDPVRNEWERYYGGGSNTSGGNDSEDDLSKYYNNDNNN
jgi:hypothetical protein